MRFIPTLISLACSTVLVAGDRHVVGSSLDARDDSGRHVVGAPADVLRRAACSADNCARAVTGTFRGAATSKQRLQDCSSFFAFTVTPATVTSTVTVTPSPVTVFSTSFTTSTTTLSITTSTTDVEVYNNNKKRGTIGAVTVSPTAVPAYASACSGTARYSSACSCAGVTASYTTVATPTTTITVTAAPSTTTEQTVATATATAGGVYQDQIPCGQTVTGADGFRITIICEATQSSTGVSLLSSTTVGDWDQCISLADSISPSTSFTYDLATRQCNVYRDSTPNFSHAPASGMVYAYFPQ